MDPEASGEKTRSPLPTLIMHTFNLARHVISGNITYVQLSTFTAIQNKRDTTSRVLNE
jgi:hypothetical protein